MKLKSINVRVSSTFNGISFSHPGKFKRDKGAIWAHFDLLLIWCLLLLQFYNESILLQHHKSNKSKFIHSPAGWECRLDHLFVSNQPSNRICESKIIPNIYSDHSAVVLSISFSEHEPPRGPGFWKFNNSLLSDTNYAELNQGTEDKGLLWEILKMEIRAFK